MNTLLFLIIIIIVAIILGSATKAASSKMILFRGKIIDIALVIYIALLLIAIVFTIGFAIKPESKVERVSNQEIVKAIEAGENFEHYAEIGMLAKADGVFINKEWHFHYEDDRLIITSKAIDGNQARVVVERKEEADNNNQVDIIQYMTKSIIDDYDYSHHLNPPKITVNKQGIFIGPSERTKIKLSKFTKEFPVKQFVDKQSVNNRVFGGVNHVRGESALYIRIPSSIEVVEGEGVSLQFVD